MRVVLDARGLGDEACPLSVAREHPNVTATARMRVSCHAAVRRHINAAILGGCPDRLDNLAGSVDPGQVQIAWLCQRRGRETQRRQQADER